MTKKRDVLSAKEVLGALGEDAPWAKYLGEKSQQTFEEPERALEIVSDAYEPKVVHLVPRKPTGSLKLEQNLGCELPVCASSRVETDRASINFTTDDGAQWKLERSADSKLPSPEHYRYWLWFLDRLKRAADQSHELPAITLDPAEFFSLFGGPRGGSQYNQLDEAFMRFSGMTVRRASVMFDIDAGRRLTDMASFHLCDYRSWRADPTPDQRVMPFAKGLVIPSPFLWRSICGGYLKSVPLKPLAKMSYVAQRLYVYLSKHCRPGGEFQVYVRNLLPKIPLDCPIHKAKNRLTPIHKALAEAGFLEPIADDGKSGGAVFLGRGDQKLLVYRRAKKVKELGS